MKTYLILLAIICFQFSSAAFELSVAGTVKDKITGLPIPNHPLKIFIDSTQQGNIGYDNTVFTDAFGVYSDTIMLPDSLSGIVYISTDSCYYFSNREAYFAVNNNYIVNNFFVCDTISSGDCEAFFTYYPANEPLTVQFIDLSYGTINSWLWDFGDGTSSTESNPVHNFPYSGQFITNLTIEGDSCESEFEMIIYVYQDTLADCEAYFTYEIDSEPLTIDFIDNSFGLVSNWLWDFGDGNNSQDQFPTHTYDLPGYYYVTLFIQTIDSCTSIYGETIWVDMDSTFCQAEFSVQLDTLNNTPNTYIFTDYSSGNIDEWLWSFGDGNISNEPNPVHTYIDQGDYLTTLTVTSFTGGSNCISTTYDTITTLQYYNFGGQVYIGDYSINIDSNNFENQATIFLYRKISNSWEYMDQMNFWKYGYYWFANKPVGEYLLMTKLTDASLEYENYAPSYYPNGISWKEAGVFNLTNNQEFAVNINLTELEEFESGIGTISGSLIEGESCNTNNNIITEDILIQLLNSSGNIIKYTYTDVSGYYEFDGLGLNTYKLQAEYPGRFSESQNVTIDELNLNITADLDIHCSHILDIEEIEFDNSINVSSPSPNPTSESTILSINSIDKTMIEISISNINGTILHSESLEVSESNQEINISVNKLNSGFYNIRVLDLTTGFVQVRKLIIIK